MSGLGESCKKPYRDCIIKLALIDRYDDERRRCCWSIAMLLCNALYLFLVPKSQPSIKQSIHATNFALLFFTWIGHAMQQTFWFHLFSSFSMCLLCSTYLSLLFWSLEYVQCQCPNRSSDPASRAGNNQHADPWMMDLNEYWAGLVY